MTRYIIRRFLLMIPTLLIVSMIVFSLIRLIPGDIAEIMVENRRYASDVEELREKLGLKNVALVRLEQLYPFPDDALAEELAKSPNAKSVIWCQEEPENQGAWFFVDRRIEKVLKSINHAVKRPEYAGRPAAAAPATGSYKLHAVEQEKLLNEALKA